MNTADEARGVNRLHWFKSSYSSGEGGECVEVALTPDLVHVRDSKVGGDGPRLGSSREAWNAFLTDL